MTNTQQIFNKSRVLLILLLLSPLGTFSQKKKAFTGMLEYKISVRDTSLKALYPDNQMFLYTNDTITRLENFTGQLGKQVTIRHMEKNKSYLLMNTPLGKYAIKTDHNSLADSTTYKSKYTFKKKWFKRKVNGIRAKRIIASHPDFKEPIEFLYLKKYSKEYLNNFPEVPGLLVKYSVSTPDGILDYELVKMEKYAPSRDLFGIPSDYKRVTIDEFMNEVIENSAPSPQDN